MPAQRSTSQALREAVRAALTSPPLVYSVDTGSSYTTNTLPTTSVIARAIWLTGGNSAPTPLVCFSAEDLGDVGRGAPGERKMRLFVWISGKNEDETTFIAEAVRARLQYADQTPVTGAVDLSRTGAAYQLPLQVRDLELKRATPCDYDDKTARWYIRCTYEVRAI